MRRELEERNGWFHVAVTATLLTLAKAMVDGVEERKKRSQKVERTASWMRICKSVKKGHSASAVEGHLTLPERNEAHGSPTPRWKRDGQWLVLKWWGLGRQELEHCVGVHDKRCGKTG